MSNITNWVGSSCASAELVNYGQKQYLLTMPILALNLTVVVGHHLLSPSCGDLQNNYGYNGIKYSMVGR
jgi:hypothetical protein